jgi:nicotinamide phosphoribosyltransferase
MLNPNYPALQFAEGFGTPGAGDIEYNQTEDLKISLICMTDSYAFSHPELYRPGIQAMSSYGSPRVRGNRHIVPFGMQMFLKKYFTQRVTMEDIDAAERFTEGHFGRKMLAREGWEHIVREYGGYIPLTIRSVPEGMVIPSELPLYSVTSFDPKVAWMSSAVEMMLIRAIWYPTSVATRDYSFKSMLRRFYQKTMPDISGLNFALHDFGGRGVTSSEQAQIGGAAHLVNFMGSDTVEGILAANFYYRSPMSAFSVPATQHSVECSFGGSRDGARAYLRHVLTTMAKPGTTVSIVIDGYDTYREAELLCTEFQDMIVNSGAKVVFRPDSGDMLEVVPRLLALQARAFGSKINSLGYWTINNVGVIQGDGVDEPIAEKLMRSVTESGLTADSVIFGSGGNLLQKMDRDTFKFAQKGSAIYVEGRWQGIAKKPATDASKSSLEGVMTTAVSTLTNEYMAADLSRGPLSPDVRDVHQLVYQNGKLYNETTMDEVRQRAQPR